MNTILNHPYINFNTNIYIWNKLLFCEIPKDYNTIEKNTILYTGKKEWGILSNIQIYKIQIEEKIYNMWITKVKSTKSILKFLKKYNKNNLNSLLEYCNGHIEQIEIVYARCYNSMKLLDPIMRKYVETIEYENNTIYAISCVAGSGKTTILIKLAEVNPKKKILYLAFNKMIVSDIKKRKIKNIKPYTFDALMRKLYLKNKNIDNFDFDIDIMDLNSYTFREKYNWFKNKPFRMIKSFISLYNKFCKDTTFIKIEDFINNYDKNIKILSPFTKKQIIKMWNDKLITFNSLRKIAYINKWFKILDNDYDMVVIDEAQDFDNLMLKMLINDTTIPKIFVGDPNQSIYQWRGAVNSFEKLPEDTHVVEFYKTWRIGNPACDTIASLFPNCWMIPGTNSKTNIFNGIEPIINYDYLFRTWRSLLETACYKKNIWINNFDKKRIMIEKLHNKIHKFGIDKDADFEDDLPNFLLKLSSRELFILIENINNNLVSKELAKCRMYTIHSYKGMENDTIRIFNDIDIENESNLYYVALTRAKKNIYID